MANATAQMTTLQALTLDAQLSIGGAVIEEPAVKPSWSIDNPTLAILTPTEDGLSCQVTASGYPGVVIVTCSAQGATALHFTTQITIVSVAPDTLLVSSSNPFQP